MKNMKNWIIFPGRKYKFIHTMNITIDDIKSIFFPKNFAEKYGYLGAIPGYYKSEKMSMLKSLVIAMDYEAKPKFVG